MSANSSAVELFTTVIMEAEVFYGIELPPKSRRRDAFLATAGAMFGEDFAGRILAFDSQAARVFSRITSRHRTLGKPITHADVQIASIVQLHKAARDW